MKQNKVFNSEAWLIGLASLLLLVPTKSSAQNWTTVLDYQYAGGASSGGNCITADSFGNIFTGGVGYPPSGFGSGLVLRTDTGLDNWFMSDNSNPSSPQYGSEVNGLTFDSLGNLYSSGTLYSPCTKTSCPGSQWYIRMSSDAGVSWTTMNLFQYATGKSCGAGSIAADLAGDVFVVGTALDANGMAHWLVRKGSNAGQGWSSVDDIAGARALGIGFVPNVGLFAVGHLSTTTTTKGSSTTTASWLVRRSLDNGNTWSTVDLLQPPTGYGAHGYAVVGDSSGNVYVAGNTTILVGSGRNSTSVSQWLVRRSSDVGNTWSTVDAFSYVSGKSSVVSAIGKDSTGNPVATGTATDSSGNQHWLVRRLMQGTWQTVDDYQLAPGQKEAFGCGVVTDAAGNLLVAGGANDSAGVTHWIVRRTNP